MRIISIIVLMMAVVSVQAMDFKKAIIRKQPTINRRESFYALFPNDTRVTVDRDFNSDDQPIYFGTYSIVRQDGCCADCIFADVNIVKMYFDTCTLLHKQQEKA